MAVWKQKGTKTNSTLVIGMKLQDYRYPGELAPVSPVLTWHLNGHRVNEYRGTRVTRDKHEPGLKVHPRAKCNLMLSVRSIQCIKSYLDFQIRGTNISLNKHPVTEESTPNKVALRTCTYRTKKMGWFFVTADQSLQKNLSYQAFCLIVFQFLWWIWW